MWEGDHDPMSRSGCCRVAMQLLPTVGGVVAAADQRGDGVETAPPEVHQHLPKT